MEIRNFFILVIFLGLLSIQIFAQGICVPDSLEVNSINGNVMAHLEGRDVAFSNVSIKIINENKPEKIVKEIKTDKDGLFDFGKLKHGSYKLIASYPGLNKFYLDLLVSSEKTSTNKNILIWLGADFLKPCSGSYAELKEK